MYIHHSSTPNTKTASNILLALLLFFTPLCNSPLVTASSMPLDVLQRHKSEADPPNSSQSPTTLDTHHVAHSHAEPSIPKLPQPVAKQKPHQQDLSSPLDDKVDLKKSTSERDRKFSAPDSSQSGPADEQHQSAPSSTTSSPAASDDNVDGELCRVNTVVRRTSNAASLVNAAKSSPSSSSLIMMMKSPPQAATAAAGQQHELVETSLTCSHVNESNYRQLLEVIYHRRQSKMSIQQLHLSNCDSLVVFSAIDLICDHLNCSTLSVFNVSGHQISDFNKLANWLSTWRQLEILDLSNTSLRSVESVFVAHTQQLTELRLDHNELTSWDFQFVFERLPNLRQLSLVNNSIFELSCPEPLRPRLRGQLDSLGLAHNSLNCDKSQLWLMKLILGLGPSGAAPANLKFPEHDQIRCRSPERLVDMTWSQRVSVLETRICDDCECRSLKKTAIAVDCHNKNLTALPDHLPVNTKILNLTSNHIGSLSVPHNSRNWENVTYLHLENNLIASMEFSSKFMRNLAALDIRRNRFQEFPSNIFEQFINLDQVHLSDNPWLCNCESTFAFQEWLQRQFHKVGDKDDIRCGIVGADENGLKSNGLDQRLSGRVIYRLAKSELCPQDTLPYDWLDVANCTLTVSIFLIVAKVVLDYIYQHRTKRLPHFFKLNF